MGPFSNKAIIDLLNQSFVPVFACNEDYLEGRKPKDEGVWLRRVWDEAREKQLPSGTVHVYILDKEGNVFNSMHVRDATNLQRLFALMKDAAQKLAADVGETLIEPQSQRRPPSVPDGSLLLHATSRYDDFSSSSGEDWIELKQKQWQEFLPPKDAPVGERWEISPPVASKILAHLYPYAADWDVSKGSFLLKKLDAYVLTREPEQTVVAVRGRVKKFHNRQPNGDQQPIDAELVGYVTFQQGKRPSFRLTTGNALYGGRPFYSLIRDADALIQSGEEEADAGQRQEEGTLDPTIEE